MKPFNKMSKAELIQYCIDNSIDYKKSWSKKQLIIAISEVQASERDFNEEAIDYLVDRRLLSMQNDLLLYRWHEMSDIELQLQAETRAKERNSDLDDAELAKKVDGQIWYIKRCIELVKNLEEGQNIIEYEMRLEDVKNDPEERRKLLFERNAKLFS